MKEQIIKKSNKNSLGYLICSILLFIGLSYISLTNREINNQLKFFVLFPCFLLVIFFAYNYLDKGHLYKINSKGIYRGKKMITTWNNVSEFYAETLFTKYVNQDRAVLLDSRGEIVTIIVVTGSTMSLMQLEHILKKKLHQRK